MTVNHSKNYKDERSGVHTNGIEGCWGRVKLDLRKYKGIVGGASALQLYLDQWMFGQMIIKKSNKSPLETVAKAVGAYYDPEW